MPAATQIWVELTAKDQGFAAFMDRMDKKLNTVGSGAEQVWINTRTAAEKYAATLREIVRMATEGEITPNTMFRARSDARRDLLGSLGIEEDSDARFLRRQTELQQAMRQSTISLVEYRRGMSAVQGEYERSSAAAQRRNSELSEERSLLSALQTPTERYERSVDILNRAFHRGSMTLDQYQTKLAMLRRDHEFNQREFLAGVNGVGKWNNAIMQASYGVQDFAQTIHMGLPMALRSTANNVSQVAMMIGGLHGAIAAAALTIGGMALASILEMNDAMDMSVSKVDRLREAFARLGDAAKEVRNIAEFVAGMKGSDWNQLQAARANLDVQMAGNEAEMNAKQEEFDRFREQGAPERLHRAVKSGMLSKEELSEINKQRKQLNDDILKLVNEREQIRAKQRAVGIQMERMPPGDLPKPEPLNPLDLPEGDQDDFLESRRRNMRMLLAESDRKAIDSINEMADSGKPGSSRFREIMEDLDVRRTAIMGTLGNTADGQAAMRQVGDAAASQLAALMNMLQGNLDAQEEKRSRQQFLGIEQLAKSIQEGSTLSKSEKAQLETAANTKTMITKIQGVIDAIGKNPGAAFQ